MGVECGMERRFLRGAELRLVEPEGERPRIEGYGAVFGVWSEDLGGFRERIRSGAFATTLRVDDIRSLFNHDANFVLGRNRSGTLSLAEDEHGLALAATPPETRWAEDLLVTMRRGDVSGMSFGFETLVDEWTIRPDGSVERELIEVRLFDVGPVTFPAYPQTSAQVRARAAEVRARGRVVGEQPGDGQGAEPGADAGAQRQGRLARMRMRLELVGQ